MALKPCCDVCGIGVRKNIAGENGGVYSTRGPLTVQIRVIKAKGESPIICERCARLAAYHGDTIAGEAVA